MVYLTLVIGQNQESSWFYSNKQVYTLAKYANGVLHGEKIETDGFVTVYSSYDNIERLDGPFRKMDIRKDATSLICGFSKGLLHGDYIIQRGNKKVFKCRFDRGSLIGNVCKYDRRERLRMIFSFKFSDNTYNFIETDPVRILDRIKDHKIKKHRKFKSGKIVKYECVDKNTRRLTTWTKCGFVTEHSEWRDSMLIKHIQAGFKNNHSIEDIKNRRSLFPRDLVEIPEKVPDDFITVSYSNFTLN
jgi:hypothetical protein